MVFLTLEFLDEHSLPAEAPSRRKAVSEAAARLAVESGRAAFAGFPDDAVVAHRESGAPYFSSPSAGDEELPRLSVSHAGNAVLVGISSGGIGVDVEPVAPLREPVLRRVFNINERNYVNKSATPDEAFAEVWTRKEAVGKAEEKGIKHAMITPVCDEYGVLSFIRDSSGGKKWRLKTYFLPGREYCVSVCAEDSSLPREVRIKS